MTFFVRAYVLFCERAIVLSAKYLRATQQPGVPRSQVNETQILGKNWLIAPVLKLKIPTTIATRTSLVSYLTPVVLIFCLCRMKFSADFDFSLQFFPTLKLSVYFT